MLNASDKIISPIEDSPEELDEPKHNFLSEFLGSINRYKRNMMRSQDIDPDLAEREYKKLAYVINRVYGYFPESIFPAQEMNKRSKLDGKMQYDFYFHRIDKNSRFAKGIKMDNPTHLGLVKRFFNFSDKKAREALTILSPDEILFIQARLNEGGLVRKKK